MSQLLTIVVPTYNRAANLALLLEALESELFEQPDVLVVIGDNASADETPRVTEKFKLSFPATKVLRHASNLGADENFCKCLDNVDTQFVWLLGDDDLPKKGVIRQVLSILNAQKPDLLYLPTEWVPEVTGLLQGSKVDQVTVANCSKLKFAAEVNVWTTFISGMIFNLEKLKSFSPSPDIRRFFGTYLVQLGWVLPLLDKGEVFLIANEQCVLATVGNSGGYPAFNVFGSNFLSLIVEFFGADSDISKSVLHRHCLGFLPGLVWGMRFGNTKTNFSKVDWETLKRSTGGGAIFWILLTPVMFFPKLAAYPSFLLARFMSRSYRKL